MFSRGGQEQRDLNGFLDRGAHVQGELRFDASFRVDGHFEGKVRSQGHLVVGEGGKVDAEVQVGHLLVSGEVRGTVRAAQQIHIAPGGRLLADIQTPSLVIEDGALFEGRCAMGGDGEGRDTAGRPAGSENRGGPKGGGDEGRPTLVAQGE